MIAVRRRAPGGTGPAPRPEWPAPCAPIRALPVGRVRIQGPPRARTAAWGPVGGRGPRDPLRAARPLTGPRTVDYRPVRVVNRINREPAPGAPRVRVSLSGTAEGSRVRARHHRPRGQGRRPGAARDGQD